MAEDKEVKEYSTDLAFAMALLEESPERLKEFLRRKGEIPWYNKKASDALYEEFGGKIVPSEMLERHCCCGHTPNLKNA